MKVIWIPAASSPIILADDALPRGMGSRSLATGLPTFRQLVQEAEYPRAETADQFPRGNIATDYRALVQYEFSHPDECHMWLAELGQLLDTSGTLKLIGARGTRSMPAVWISVEPQRQFGAAADVLYHFRGTLFT
jgi:hypothetical protein